MRNSINSNEDMENLGAWNVTLTDAEFADLEQTLDSIEIHGHRGIVEFEGDTMQQWHREKK